MTSADKAPLDMTPWEPTVYTGDSDADQEKAAAQQYAETYGGTPNYVNGTSPNPGTPQNTVSVPDLTDAPTYSSVPDFIPVKGNPSSSGTPETVTGSMFGVDLGVLRNTETTFFNSVQTLVSAYDTLQGVVKNAISSPSIYGQDVGQQKADITNPSLLAKGGDGTTITTDYDQLDSEGKQFAASMNPALEHLMQNIADSIEAMGVFTALFNNSGQMYTDTDSAADLPPS